MRERGSREGKKYSGLHCAKEVYYYIYARDDRGETAARFGKKGKSAGDRGFFLCPFDVMNVLCVFLRLLFSNHFR